MIAIIPFTVYENMSKKKKKKPTSLGYPLTIIINNWHPPAFLLKL